MPLIASILSKLSRVTSGGRFIPVVDGLRFVAIMSVMFYHLNDSLLHHQFSQSNIKATFVLREDLGASSAAAGF